MRRQLFPREKYPDGHPDLARSLNNRPRATLDYMKPSEKLAEIIATAA